MNYELKRSNRKSVSIQITKDCSVLVKAPLLLSKKTIDDFVEKHNDWILQHIEIQKELNKNAKPEPTQQEIKLLKQQAKEYIFPKVEEYAKIMGLEYGTLKITSAKTRYGSCGVQSHNLCFSYKLIDKPKEAVDYVIVHELAHIVHPDHSREFYNYIEKYMPDYKQRVKLLKSTERNGI